MKTVPHPELTLGLLALVTPITAINSFYAASYFVLYGGTPLVTERVDPIMAPGVIGSNHVHEIYGGSGFQANWDYATAQNSQCNNMGPKIDHSNYWYSALYFHEPGTDNYTRVPTDFQIYYHYDLLPSGEARKPFPHAFKMISGNAMLRHNDNLTDLSTESIRWYCHADKSKGETEAVTQGTFAPGTTGCSGTDGFSSEIWFPFCHNGAGFDISKPTDHVIFGNGPDGTPTHQGGNCPTSHPTTLPQLFMEFHHTVSGFKWSADQNPWVLAQGDPTGYGMHADFVNGWEDGFADQIAVDPNDKTKTVCNVGESGADLSTCFEMLPDDVKKSCTVASALTEDVVGPMTALAGCNPIQSGPATATIVTTCAGYKAGALAAGSTIGASDKAPTTSSPALASSLSMVMQTGMPSNAPVNNQTARPVAPIATASSSPAMPAPFSSSPPSSGGIPNTISVKDFKGATETWIYQGCYTDLIPNRDIRTLKNWGQGATSSDCANSCIAMGQSIAGTENGGQCFCGNTMAQTKKVSDGDCNMACNGSSQMCGRSGRLQVYAKEGTNLGLKKRSNKHRHALNMRSDV